MSRVSSKEHSGETGTEPFGSALFPPEHLVRNRLSHSRRGMISKSIA